MAQFELEMHLSYASVIPLKAGSHGKEMGNAKQTLRKLANALNVQLNEDFLSAQRNTFDDLNCINPSEIMAAVNDDGQRLLSDDSAIYERLQYVSAADFARVF